MNTKILIVTQKIDANDSILGFFHKWVIEFAKSFERVTVVCLEKGECDLPSNVRVFSLGKEKRTSRFRYIWNFYRYIWRERKNYDVVFVHMNQEYVLLGWKLWRLMGKKIYLWRNHKKGGILTRFAVLVSHRVFCTSPDSFTAQFRKTKLMPAGIDTDFFKKDPMCLKKRGSLLFFGRVSPVKKVEIFIAACRLLKDKKADFSADIIGDSRPSDQVYRDELKELIEKAGLGQCVILKPGVSFLEAPALYNQYDICVNATPSGSFDKTILEALACETLVVTSNRAFRGFINDQFIFSENDSSDLAEKTNQILRWSEEKKLHEGVLGREKVKIIHDLPLLVREIKKEISSRRFPYF